jgi:hypothetical protein
VPRLTTSSSGSVFAIAELSASYTSRTPGYVNMDVCFTNNDASTGPRRSSQWGTILPISDAS